MYTIDKSDSILELSPIVVKFADRHNFSTNWLETDSSMFSQSQRKQKD